MKILVIDDERVIRVFLAEVLTELGHEVTTAVNGKNGLDVFRHNPDYFDIVFTDRKMPGGVFGEEIICEIKKISPKTFVVFMSGDAQEEVERIGKAAGADRIFFKPIRLESIEKAVLEAISASKG